MPAPRKDYSKAVELYHGGWAVSDIADKYCITRQAMHSILKRRGVEFPPNKIYKPAQTMTPTTPSPIADQAAGEPIAWLIRWPNGNAEVFMDLEVAKQQAAMFRTKPVPLSVLSTAPTTGSAPVAIVALGRYGQSYAMMKAEVPIGTPLFVATPANAELDARRYRWLRNPDVDVALVLDKVTGEVPTTEGLIGGGYKTYEYRAGVELDTAIDKAMGAYAAPASRAASDPLVIARLKESLRAKSSTALTVTCWRADLIALLAASMGGDKA